MRTQPRGYSTEAGHPPFWVSTKRIALELSRTVTHPTRKYNPHRLHFPLAQDRDTCKKVQDRPQSLSR